MTIHRTGQPGATGLPSRSARWLIHTAVHLLPPGPTRVRYDRELIAELYDMPLDRQFRHALAVVGTMGALRTAIAGQPAPAVGSATVTAPHVPLICRLNIRHRWRREHTGDGGLYWRCVRCGKDWDERAPGSTPFNP